MYTIHPLLNILQHTVLRYLNHSKYTGTKLVTTNTKIYWSAALQENKTPFSPMNTLFWTLF